MGHWVWEREVLKVDWDGECGMGDEWWWEILIGAHAQFSLADELEEYQLSKEVPRGTLPSFLRRTTNRPGGTGAWAKQ